MARTKCAGPLSAKSCDSTWRRRSALSDEIQGPVVKKPTFGILKGNQNRFRNGTPIVRFHLSVIFR